MEDSKNSEISTPQMKCTSKTPKRTLIQQRFGTPLQRSRGTPSSSKKSAGKEERTTPVSANPFEVDAESLYFSSCSPSVFATFARNKNDSGHFRWSIDHVSVLYPAEIDETSIPNMLVDPEQEAKAQKAIDTFFSQNSIVPSPWSSGSAERGQCKFRSSRFSMLDIDTNEAASQTMVTIPPDVDLAALLGSEYLYNEENDCQVVSPNSSGNSSGSFRDSDSMNASSLRRKLFVADEICKTPSRLERKDLFCAKQWCTPSSSTRSMQSTPSDLLASSPITPPNCSESCITCTSPQMSPIAHSAQRNQRSLLRSRSFNERLDEESNSELARKQSSEFMDAKSEISMSFCMDSESTSAFQLSSSQKQDTGYVTSSMSSMQNITSDCTNMFLFGIKPIAEHLGDCRMKSNSADSDYGMNNDTADMSYVNNNNGMSVEDEKTRLTKFEGNDSVLCGSDKWSLMPNSCSTPAFNL